MPDPLPKVLFAANLVAPCGMLTSLLTVAQLLKDNPDVGAAIAAMRDAAAGFPDYVDDPGWSARIKSQPQ